MTITLAVADRIATAEYDDRPVAGNAYAVTMSLDAEWTGTLYVRVRFGRFYYDIPFASTDATVDVQLPIGYPEAGIGIYSEALQISSSEARIRMRPSILEYDGAPVEFDSTLYDQWASEVTQLLTDDDWSATSTRPLRNSVLTAWKGTVALDANVVHKTGYESISGQKNFQSVIFVPTYTGVNTSVAVNRAMLASDTTIVHTSGDETIAGAKTFAGTLKAPTYTADNDADTRAVNRSMLAQTPTIVHTTGTETIAGSKTFTGTLVATDFAYGTTSTIVHASTWCKLYEYTPYAYGSGLEASLYNDYNLFGMVNSSVRVFSGSSPGYALAGALYHVSGYLAGKVARRASDGVVEIWVKNLAGGNILLSSDLRHTKRAVVTTVGSEGEEPVQGATYSSVVEMEVVQS